MVPMLSCNTACTLTVWAAQNWGSLIPFRSGITRNPHPSQLGPSGLILNNPKSKTHSRLFCPQSPSCFSPAAPVLGRMHETAPHVWITISPANLRGTQQGKGPISNKEILLWAHVMLGNFFGLHLSQQRSSRIEHRISPQDSPSYLGSVYLVSLPALMPWRLPAWSDGAQRRSEG